MNTIQLPSCRLLGSSPCGFPRFCCGFSASGNRNPMTESLALSTTPQLTPLLRLAKTSLAATHFLSSSHYTLLLNSSVSAPLLFPRSRSRFSCTPPPTTEATHSLTVHTHTTPNKHSQHCTVRPVSLSLSLSLSFLTHNCIPFKS